MKIFILLTFIVISLNVSAADKSFSQQIPNIMNQCGDCHGEDKQKGGIDFKELSKGHFKDEHLKIISKSIELINNGEMPPPKKRTLKNEQKQILTDELKSFVQKQQINTQTAYRRLNRNEYRNSVAELFNIDLQGYDPARFLPHDQRYEGLDKIGSELMSSIFLSESYLKTAHELVEKFLLFEEKPKAIESTTLPRRLRAKYVRDKTNRTDSYATLNGAPYNLPAEIGFRDFRASEDGTYRIEILAEGVNQRHDMPKNFFSNDQDEPIRMSVVTGPNTNFNFIATFDTYKNKKWYQTELWLNKGEQPTIIYSNGILRGNRVNRKLYKTERFKKLMSPAIIKRNVILHKEWANVFLPNLPIPQLRVYKVKIHGPFYKLNFPHF